MKSLKRIAVETPLDQERSAKIRRECNTENINKWIYKRKQEWDQHINRIEVREVVRIVRDKSSIERRSVG